MPASLRTLTGQIMCLVAISIIIFAVSVMMVTKIQTQNGLLEAAQARQTASLEVLKDAVLREVPDIVVTDTSGGRSVTWNSVERPGEGHELIDRVGAVSGETATIFGWDAEAGDFVRLTTNIIKEDGTRAVGTYLGVDNPVFDAIMAGQTYRGEATILGTPYLTIYEPTFSDSGEPTGILYVGVNRANTIDRKMAALWTRSLTLTGLLLAGALALVYFGSRWLLRPLADLENSVAQLSDGNYEVDIPHSDRTDQIGGIARAMDILRGGLMDAQAAETRRAGEQQAQARVVDHLSRGLSNLAAKKINCRIEDADFPTEYEVLRQDFNAVSDRLGEAISEIMEVTNGLRDSAEGTDRLASNMSSRVESQVATVEEARAALEQLSTAGQQISERVATANSISTESADLSKTSGERLEDAVAAMARIEEASGKIDTIIGLIEDIAFQTNLLALNAGVEAARAGEAGRGFSVVATEVRNLAQRATTSVGEIRTLVQRNFNEVQQGSALVTEAGASIGDVLSRIDHLAHLMDDVATDVESQARDITELNGSVQQVERDVGQVSTIAHGAHRSSGELKTGVGRLFAVVQQFDFEATTAKTAAHADGRSRQA